MSEVFLGQIMLGGFDFAPAHFALCNGQILPIAQNQALFSLLGTQYGGNGTTTFALPDMRGRTPLGADGNSYTQGQAGGIETVTLTNSTLPTHTHGFMGSTTDATARSPADALYGKTSNESIYASPGSQATLASQTVGASGGSQAHNNMQPYLATNFFIALSGIFPSRS
jgi:microcystin-dependent protein